jgi:diaminopimelate decarboxylase
MLLDTAENISDKLGIRFEIINIGGGFGIPYKPDAAPLNLVAMAQEITDLFRQFEDCNGYMPALHMESGRFIAGPHGALVATAINRKEIYRTHIGVDASMSALMRPGIYGAYHHIDVLGKQAGSMPETVDVVGSLCENNDKFAIQRELPRINNGDLLCIHDTGAHGHAMGFNYNGRLRPKELLLRSDGSVELIRREETVDDYFATLDFQPDIKAPAKAAKQAA